jgi:hypothetical protein
MSHQLCIMTVLIKRIGPHIEISVRWWNKFTVSKDSRLNKNSDLTLDIEKSILEKSDSSTDQIVPNDKHVSNNIVKEGKLISKWLVPKEPI